MRSQELLGPVEVEVLAAVNRGALPQRRHAAKVHRLAGEFLFHESLRRCEEAGLLPSERDPRGRRYALTAKGPRRLRVERRYRAALRGLIGRSLVAPG